MKLFELCDDCIFIILDFLDYKDLHYLFQTSKETFPPIKTILYYQKEFHPRLLDKYHQSRFQNVRQIFQICNSDTCNFVRTRDDSCMIPLKNINLDVKLCSSFKKLVLDHNNTITIFVGNYRISFHNVYACFSLDYHTLFFSLRKDYLLRCSEIQWRLMFHVFGDLA